MAHWRRVLPADRFLELDYEALVTAQEAQSRRLVAHAGLAWDEACLAFEHNPQPTLTASAAQVRQQIYRSSVGLWRHYERELAPLRRRLEAAGVRIDDTGAAAGVRPRTPPPARSEERRGGNECVSTGRFRGLRSTYK